MNLRKDHYWFCLTHFYVCVGEQTWHARSGSLLSQIELYLKLLGHWAIVCFNFICHTTVKLNCLISNSGWKMKNYWKILSGGSLGSYVDEGRSKMREIVWIAGHIEHRYSERKLQSKARLCSTPVWGSLLNHSNLRIGNYECVSACVLTRSGGNWLISSRCLVYAQLSRVVCSCDDAHFLTSDQTRVLAEFKHIIKRRKRN